MFDFPLPFGPTIAVIGFSKANRVAVGKDLNPWISRDLRYRLNTSFLHTFDALYIFGFHFSRENRTKIQNNVVDF
jgi:hypothetical protein